MYVNLISYKSPPNSYSRVYWKISKSYMLNLRFILSRYSWFFLYLYLKIVLVIVIYALNNNALHSCNFCISRWRCSLKFIMIFILIIFVRHESPDTYRLSITQILIPQYVHVQWNHYVILMSDFTIKTIRSYTGLLYVYFFIVGNIRCEITNYFMWRI